MATKLFYCEHYSASFKTKTPRLTFKNITMPQYKKVITSGSETCAVCNMNGILLTFRVSTVSDTTTYRLSVSWRYLSHTQPHSTPHHHTTPQHSTNPYHTAPYHISKHSNTPKSPTVPPTPHTMAEKRNCCRQSKQTNQP